MLDGEVSRATLFPFFPLSVSLIRILRDFPIRVRVRVGDDTVFLFPQIAFGFFFNLIRVRVHPNHIFSQIRRIEFRVQPNVGRPFSA